jgi:hypothetical protein
MRWIGSVIAALVLAGCIQAVPCPRAIQCVASCGEPPVSSGCGPCSEGTFDSITCRADGGEDAGSATVPTDASVPTDT